MRCGRVRLRLRRRERSAGHCPRPPGRSRLPPCPSALALAVLGPVPLTPAQPNSTPDDVTRCPHHALLGFCFPRRVPISTPLAARAAPRVPTRSPLRPPCVNSVVTLCPDEPRMALMNVSRVLLCTMRTCPSRVSAHPVSRFGPSSTAVWLEERLHGAPGESREKKKGRLRYMYRWPSQRLRISGTIHICMDSK